jgi:hypothetical protein
MLSVWPSFRHQLLNGSTSLHEFCHLLGHSAVLYVRVETFRKNVSPTSSGSRINRAIVLHAGFLLGWFSTLKMEVLRSPETFHIRTTRRYTSQDGNFHNSLRTSSSAVHINFVTHKAYLIVLRDMIRAAAYRLSTEIQAYNRLWFDDVLSSERVPHIMKHAAV